MSYSENLVPEIVEVESCSSTSTLTGRMFEESSETSSEESVGNRGNGNTPQITDDVFVVTVAQTPASMSYANLTIPVAIPLDPRTPKTTYAEVNATSLTIRDIPYLTP